MYGKNEKFFNSERVKSKVSQTPIKNYRHSPVHPTISGTYKHNVDFTNGREKLRNPLGGLTM